MTLLSYFYRMILGYQLIDLQDVINKPLRCDKFKKAK